jgi:two-component system OmpR family response regulator
MDKLRVLIVDDDDVVRAQLRAVLAKDYVVYELPSAIGVTREILKHRIDVVTIDIVMPSLSGDKLAALLRQNPRLNSLAVVLISSRPPEEMESLAKVVGADATVSKADTRTKLLPAIEDAVFRRRRGARASS